MIKKHGRICKRGSPSKMNSLQTKTGKRGNADDMFYEPLTRQVILIRRQEKGKEK